jgi:hypothetical protein
MANKKISELESRASLSLSDLMAVGDPSTGYLYKTTISDLKTLTGAGVVSFNGRFGTVNPAEGDYTLTQLGDVIITTPSNAQVLQYNGSNWVNSSLNLTTTLAALTDVAITSIANNQLLRYNSTSQKWENWTPNYLTAESDTLDTVTTRGATTSNGITVGSVSAAGLSNLLGQIRTFATTGNTYIGASPASASDAGYKLDLNGTARISGDMTMWDDGTNNGNSRALIFRALGSTGNAQTGQIILDGFGAAGQDQLQLSASNIRLSPTTGSVTITGTTPNISTVAASGFRLNANSTTNGFTFTQSYNQTSGDLLAIFTNSNQKKFSVSHAGIVTVADLGGTGSRMVVADANGVMSTQAIPSLSGYVTLDTAQTITATKTFSSGIVVSNSGIQISGGTTDYLNVETGGEKTYFGTSFIRAWDKQSGGSRIINLRPAGLAAGSEYSVSFPAKSGTIAFTDDIPSVAGVYLPLAGGTLTGGLIGTTGSFAASGSGDTFAINHSSGSGIALNITKAGNGEGLYINKTSGSGNAATIIGTLNATTLVKSGGTSSQFLKADGSVDSNTYLTSASVAGVYLPLAGGTLTGALNGTSATFSGTVQAGTNFISVPITDSITVGTSAAENAKYNYLGHSGYWGLKTTATGFNFALDTYNSGTPKNVLTITQSGAATFSGNLLVSVNQNNSSVINISNTTAGTSSQSTFQANSDATSGYATFGKFSSSTNAYKIIAASNAFLYTDKGDIAILNDNASGAIKLAAGASSTAHLTIASTGAATFSSSVTANGDITYYNAGNLNAIITSGAANNGRMYLYSAGSPDIGLQAGGSSWFTGNLGIGITNPSEKLHLRDSTTGYVGLRLEGSGSYAGSDWTIYSSASSPNSANDFLGFYNNSATDSATQEYKFKIFKTGVAEFVGDVKVKTLEVTNVGTDSTSSGVSTYMRITVNGQNYLIPLHGTP